MRAVKLFFVLLVFMPVAYAQQINKPLSWPEITNVAKPYTRWWLADSFVDTAKLSLDLAQLRKMGIGAIEIVPMYNAKGEESRYTPRISKERVNMVSNTINKAERLGIKTEIANVTGFQFLGPQVDPDNAALKLILQTFDAKEGYYFDKNILPTGKEQQHAPMLQIVMAFSGSGQKINLTSKVTADGKLKWMPSEGKWKIVAVFTGNAQQKIKHTASGGEGFVLDYFSSKAFNAYLQRFDDSLSAPRLTLPKVFFNYSYEGYDADWTPELFTEFKARKGYALEDFLNFFAGYGDAEEVARIKSDYREVLAGMLMDNFTKPWVNWVHSKGGLARYQAQGFPGNILDLYAASDIPEGETFVSSVSDFDGLTRDSVYTRPSDADPLMIKFASSAAHIANRSFISSASFARQGEHFRVSLSQCKPWIDDLFIAGVNHMYVDETTYNPKEAISAGAILNFSSNDSLLREMGTMNAYISRCQSFLQMGSADNDLLLYFPIYDVWHNEKGTVLPIVNDNAGQWLTKSAFYKASQLLMDKGYGIDFISDLYIKEASADKGKVSIGRNSYKAIVVPMCRFMPYETFKALIDLVQNGATVLFVEFPSEVPGWSDFQNKNDKFQELVRELALMPHESRNKLAAYGKGKMAINGSLENMLNFLDFPHEGIADFKVKYVRRKNNTGYHYFMVNQQAFPIDAWVDIAVDAKAIALFDPLTGNSGMALTRIQQGKLQVYLQLKPGESLILQTFSAFPKTGAKWQYR
jgi:hypothetical protein